MHTFTREIPHPSDRLPGVSAAAVARFEHDHKRFPPTSYEDESLLWKGEEWRQLDAEERAMVMGIPPSLLRAVPKKDRTRRQQEAVCNSLVGNSFHVPSILPFFILLIQLIPAAAHVNFSLTCVS